MSKKKYDSKAFWFSLILLIALASFAYTMPNYFGYIKDALFVILILGGINLFRILRQT